MEGPDQIGLGESGHGAAAEVGGDQAADQQHDGRIFHQPLEHGGQRGRIGGRGCAVDVTAGRLPQGQLGQQRQQDAGQAQDHEGHAPVEGGGQPAPEDSADHHTEGHAGEVDRQRRGSPAGREMVGQQGVRRRAAAAFADPHAHAEDEQRRIGTGHAAKRGHQRPEGDADGDDVDPARSLGQAGDRNAQDDVEDRERGPGQQPELRVRDPQIADDRRADRRDDHPVQEARGIDRHQQAEQPAEIGAREARRRIRRRNRSCAGLRYGRHGVPPLGGADLGRKSGGWIDAAASRPRRPRAKVGSDGRRARGQGQPVGG